MFHPGVCDLPRELAQCAGARHTGQPYDKVTQDTERDLFMSSDEAREYGIVDRVIPSR